MTIRPGAVWLFLVCLMLGTYRVGPALAQAGTGVIREIRIEGTQRIEPETVRTYMRVNPGDPFDPVRLDRSLKNIFSSGLFADVTLRREGDALIVSVVENPIVNRIAFEGNRRLEDDALSAEISLRPRVVFTRTKVQNDMQRLLEIYRRSGRYAATVEPKVIQLEQNRIDLVFEINEGPLTRIESINFIGNHVFSDSDLKGEIATSETNIFSFLSSTDTYDPDRLNFDKELLRRFYLSEGYADFRVASLVAELLPDLEGFIVTFTVEEGQRQKFGAIDIVSALPNLDPKTLTDNLLMKEGDWYNAQLIEDTIANLTDAVGNLGYAFVDIKPKPKRDRESRTIDITFAIAEGPRVFVERIDVEGNVRTLDKVVRREMQLVEGDAFNAAKIRESRKRIQNLGFFRTAKVEAEQGSAPDLSVIRVEVEEQSTGDLSFGAGFSSSAGPVGNVGIRERNLLGRGQDLRLNFTLSGEQSQLNLGFTEPYFLNRNVSAGFDLFRIQNNDNQRSFSDRRTGGSLRTGFNWQKDVRQTVRYTLQDQKITDVDSDASILVKDEEGRFIESRLGHELNYDTRDNRFDPHEGYVARLRNEFAGLGGDVFFLRSSVGGAYYYPIAEKWTASTRGEIGNIFGLGQDTHISDRKFIGGSDCRGFQTSGVGPRDLVSNDPLGGKNFYTGSLELDFPLGLPDEFDIRGRLFTDACAAWSLDSNLVSVQDESTPRVSVGGGFSWNSPFGPVVVDIGFAVIKEDFDETEVFNFNFGTQF